MPVTTTEPKFNCSTCGKEYRWKPELAGKKAKCKCGNVISVPTKAPAAAKPKPAQSDDLDGLYALAQEEKKATARTARVDENASGYRCPSCSANMPPGAVVCPSCNLDMRTGMRQPVAAVAGAGVGPISAVGAYANTTRASRTLAYGGAVAGAVADRDVIWEGGKARSLYLPVGLIVLGLLFYFGQIAFSSDKLTAGLMLALVFARVVMDSVLIFIAMLIAVKGFDMGFGAFGPGVLKILAIAMGPGALGEMVEEMMGPGFGSLLVGALVTLTLYGTLIKVLFNLDLGETFLLMFLIYGVRRVLGTFLFVAFIGMTSSGLLDEEKAEAVADGAVAVATATPAAATASDDEYYPPKRTLDPEEIAHDLDKSARARLTYLQGGSVAADWLEGYELHRFSNLDHAQSKALVKALLDAGAKGVLCSGFMDVETPEGGRVSRVTSLTVEMPEDPLARKKIFNIRRDMLKQLGQPEEMIEVEAGGRPDEQLKTEPMKDWGQTLLEIDFGPDKDAKHYDGDDRFSARLKQWEETQKADEEYKKKMDAEAAGKAPAEGEKPAKPDAPGDAEESDEEDEEEMAEDAAEVAPF